MHILFEYAPKSFHRGPPEEVPAASGLGGANRGTMLQLEKQFQYQRSTSCNGEGN